MKQLLFVITLLAAAALGAWTVGSDLDWRLVSDNRVPIRIPATRDRPDRGVEAVRMRDNFDEAIRCDPDQEEARCNLAELALRDGDFDLAIEGFRAVLSGDPDHLEAHYGIARALLRVGGRAQAKAHLERFCQGVEGLPAALRPDELERRRDQAAVVLRSLARAGD